MMGGYNIGNSINRVSFHTCNSFDYFGVNTTGSKPWNVSKHGNGIKQYSIWYIKRWRTISESNQGRSRFVYY